MSAPADTEPVQKTRKEFIELLSRTLIAEQVSFTQFSMMLAVADHLRESSEGDVTNLPAIDEVAERLGVTYHAVRNQALRSPWLAIRHTDKHRLTVTQDGITKYIKIHKRLKQEDAAY